MCKLEPAVMAPHAAAIVQRLGADHEDVRHRASEVSCRREPAALALHAAAFVQQRSDDDRMVRCLV